MYKSHQLATEIPQGSVLGPLLFSKYMTLLNLGKWISLPQLHCTHTQLYLPLFRKGCNIMDLKKQKHSSLLIYPRIKLGQAS